VVDNDNFLWILDTANPQFKGIVPSGPKLVKVDLASNSIMQTIRFAAPVIEPASYLNDVRIDTRRQVAYLTDSGAGAIIVTNLSTGTSRRLLANHSSTHAEEITLTIEGKSWLRNGSPVRVHADGIALDSEGEYLYYQALTGRTLYRIETRWLRDPLITEQDLTGKIETVGKTGAADGLVFMDGRVYISALEENAIKTVVPGSKAEILVQSPQLAWPDSFSFGPDGSLYVTTSQIHHGQNPANPYKIFTLSER
jgi:sugar lactone lactonase YvrE